MVNSGRMQYVYGGGNWIGVNGPLFATVLYKSCCFRNEVSDFSNPKETTLDAWISASAQIRRSEVRLKERETVDHWDKKWTEVLHKEIT